MPTYQYRCKSCDYTFTIVQSMRDEPLRICPQCEQEIHRVITGGTGIIFKGAGFYVTDAKTSKSNSPADPVKAPEPDKKPETKPVDTAPCGTEKKSAG
jgi:putative FmdB family regulatory protein